MIQKALHSSTNLFQHWKNCNEYSDLKIVLFISISSCSHMNLRFCREEPTEPYTYLQLDPPRRVEVNVEQTASESWRSVCLVYLIDISLHLSSSIFLLGIIPYEQKAAFYLDVFYNLIKSDLQSCLSRRRTPWNRCLLCKNGAFWYTEMWRVALQVTVAFGIQSRRHCSVLMFSLRSSPQNMPSEAEFRMVSVSVCSYFTLVYNVCSSV